jgi:hypothetical protein
MRMKLGGAVVVVCAALIGAGAFLLLIAPLVNKLMHGVR